jgi:endoglucanase
MKRRYLTVLALWPLAALWGCGADTTTTPDTTPPLAPQLGGATLQDGTLGVWWQANTEPDLAGYNVYLVEGGVTHSAAANPITSNYLIIDAGTASPIYVYVTAIDYSSNESSPSASLRASTQITDPIREIVDDRPKE